MRLTFGVPYMARHGPWRLSVVYVVAPARIGCVVVRRWSAKGKRWSQPRVLAGGICRAATVLDCTARGLPDPSAAWWTNLRVKLARENGARDVKVPWEFAVTFNHWG